MLTTTIIAGALLVLNTASQPQPQAPTICSQATSPRAGFSYVVDEGVDGVRFANLDLIYALSDGALGEVYLVVDALGQGEMVLAIDGEVVGVAATGTPTALLNPAVEPDLMAELLSLLAHEDPECLIPLAFECSDFGKKATAATRWLFKTATYVTAAACCTLSSGVACVVCSTGALVGGDYVDEQFANHCG